MSSENLHHRHEDMSYIFQLVTEQRTFALVQERLAAFSTSARLGYGNGRNLVSARLLIAPVGGYTEVGLS